MLFNHYLSNYTTLKIGGPAELFYEPKNIKETINIINWANSKKIPYYIVGAGSNLLISDKGVSGLVICTRKIKGKVFNSEQGILKANCGESLPGLARRAVKEGLEGLEWGIGIPGTLGGSVVMNAGAQGGSIDKSLISVTVYCKKRNQILELEKKDLNFSYRSSIFQQGAFIVLSAKLKVFKSKNIFELNKKIEDNLRAKTSTQPYQFPSCGSVFKNPENHQAGKIIDKIGLKGKKIGGAEISDMHANFIVNKSKASSDDVIGLINLVKNRIKDKYGILLDLELKQLGFPRND